MEILSLKEDLNISRQTDTICLLIENHVDALRGCKLGKKTRLNGVSCELLQKGRNAVYRLSNENDTWFLKIVCGDKRMGIEGEILGYQFIRQHFDKLGYYHHPESVRASEKLGYILVSQIPGGQINHALYKQCFSPFKKDWSQLMESFHRCGVILGQFHKKGMDFKGRDMKSGLASTLGRRLARVKKPDAMTKKIADWHAGNNFETETGIVHGNCTFRNIFVHEEKISLLDFETLGHGSRYNDLSRICSDILIGRIAIFFPWKRAQEALGAFLKGYRSAYPYDADMLMKYTALYLFDRYLQVYMIKKGKETVSGIPVSHARHHWMLERLLAGDSRSLFPGIEI